MVTKVALLVVGVVVSVAVARPDGGVAYKQPAGQFMYLNVPGPKEYEAGYNRGNDKHSISRFEQVKDHRFRTRVKWNDKDGYGEHYYEFNHAPKYHEPEHYHEPVHHHEPEYHHIEAVHHTPAYSGQEAVVVNAPLYRAALDAGVGGDWSDGLFDASALKLGEDTFPIGKL